MNTNLPFSDLELTEEMVQYIETHFQQPVWSTKVTFTLIGMLRRFFGTAVGGVSAEEAVRLVHEAAKQRGVPWVGEVSVVDDGLSFTVTSNSMSRGMNAWAIVDIATGNILKSGFASR